MIRTGRTTRLLNVDSHERAVMIGVAVAVVVLTIAGKASEYRPASVAAVPVPPIVLLATPQPTAPLPTVQPTIAPVVVVVESQPTVEPTTAQPTAAPIVEPTATPLPPTAIPPTEPPAPVEQAPAQQWVPETAPVANPDNQIDATEQKIQELPQEVAHPWAPDLPPPARAGNGAQS